MVLVSTIHFLTSAHFKGAPHLKVCTVVLHAPRSDGHLPLVLLLTPSSISTQLHVTFFPLVFHDFSPCLTGWWHILKLSFIVGAWKGLLHVACSSSIPSQLESDLSWSFVFSSFILLRSSYPDPRPVTYKSVSPALPRTPDLYIQRPTHLCMGGWLTSQI